MTDAPDPRDDVDRAVDAMADLSVWTADEWRRMLEASAAGATIDGLLPRVKRGPRTWLGEAQAAYDQALTTLASTDSFGDPDFWVARAAAAAAIEQAVQARTANLIAYQQLRIRESDSPLHANVDHDDIEEALWEPR